MGTAIKAIESYYRHISWILTAIPPLVYFYYVIRYTANTPITDDLYDTLSTLIRYRESESISDIIHSMTWQYHQHFVIYDRIVYWVFYTFTEIINFKKLALIGNLSLVVLFFQIGSGIEKNRSIALPAISAIIFSLYFEEDTFWSMGSIQQLSIMAMTLAAFQLLENGKFIFLACLVSWLAIFTQSNEILIIPLGFLLLLDNVYKRHSPLLNRNIIIWTLSGVICLAVFIAFENISIVNEHYIKFSPFMEKTGNIDILINFLASLASLPFTRIESINYAASIGIIHLAVIGWIFCSNWKNNRPLSLMLAFCVLSLLAAAVTRTALNGPSAFVSRYKIFCVCIVAIEIALLANTHLRKRWLLVLLASSFALNSYSYYINTDYIARYKTHREKTIMQWFYNDEIQTLPLANAILDEAYSTGLYNPARDINYAAIPTAITEKESCPQSQSQSHLTITLKTAPSSRAVLLSVQKPHGIAAPIPDSLWLCGQKNYHIIAPKTETTRHLTSPDGQQMVILEKRLFPEDEYLLMHQTGNEIAETSVKIDTHFSPKESRDCARHQETLELLYPSLQKRYCKEG